MSRTLFIGSREYFPGHHLLELFRIIVETIDADQGEGFVFKVVYERPLVRPGNLSDQSELEREIQQHDLAAIVAQFE